MMPRRLSFACLLLLGVSGPALGQDLIGTEYERTIDYAHKVFAPAGGIVATPASFVAPKPKTKAKSRSDDVVPVEVFDGPPTRGNAPASTGNAATSKPVTGPAGIKPTAPPPVPQSVVEQAELQREGFFGPLDRPEAGGMIQDAWDYSDKRSGAYVTPLCQDCIYKVRLREFAVTTIILPEDADIEAADVGDATAFQVQVRGANKIAVRPAGYGMDSNLNVYTANGKTYSFYLRAESFNSVNLPDLTVRITGLEKPAELAVSVPVSLTSAKGQPLSLLSLQNTAVEGLQNPKPNKGDYVRTVAFDPSKLHGFNDYAISGDRELKPARIFRDDRFTYIQYDHLWDGSELPTAYLVYDDIDELVNTRVQGSTLIVEAVGKKIVLKSGKKYLCITYEGGV